MQSGNWDNVLMTEQPSDEAEDFSLARMQQEGLGADESSFESTALLADADTNNAAEEDEVAPVISNPSSSSRTQQQDLGTSNKPQEPPEPAEGSASSISGGQCVSPHLPDADLSQAGQSEAFGQLGRAQRAGGQRSRSNYEELSESALRDPLTSREGEALQKSLGGAGVDIGVAASGDGQDAMLGQLKKEVGSAGKPFMDSLAQNVGLGADDELEDRQAEQAMQHGLANASNEVDDVIDAIATGQDKVPPQEQSAAAGVSSAGSASSSLNGSSAAASPPTLKFVTDMKVRHQSCTDANLLNQALKVCS